jgi:hypothetical protein
MLTSNNPLFSSQAAANGVWRNISNFFSTSIHVTGLEGNVWIEVSNDPNVLTNGATISAPATPVLSQYTPSNGVAGIAANTTYYVKTTFITPGGGETTASTEASLLVTAGNLLVVASPAKDTGGFATAYNVYVSTTTGSETKQTSDAKPIGQPFILYGLSSGIVVPGANTSGSPASGISITGNLAAGSFAVPGPAAAFNQIQIVIANGQAMINPSGAVWNYMRVCKDSTANTKLTSAFLFGQQG